MKTADELIDEFLNYKGVVYSSRVWKEIVKRLKEHELIKHKSVIIFQNLAALEGIVFKEGD